MLSPPNISGGAGGAMMNVPEGGGDGGDTGAGPTGSGDIGPVGPTGPTGAGHVTQ